MRCWGRNLVGTSKVFNMASDKSEYVGRIDQIDSIELDNEFISGKWQYF